MRRFAVFLIGLCVLAGCRKAERPVVGVVPKGASHLFWQTVHAGAIKAAQEYGLDLEWNAPAMESDAGRQIEIVQSMITRHLAGIALAPVERTSLARVVDSASSAGIPVAIFDSEIDTGNRISYVATDNREAGRIAASALGEILLGEGEVAIIGFVPGSASTTERDEGFTEEMTKKFPNIRIVQTVFGMSDRAKARALTENILAAHPNLRGLFTDNESSSAGAVMALKARNNTQVRTVAFDSNDQLIEDLRNRIIDALILQDPFLMGYESVKAIGMKLKGQTPKIRIDSGVYLVKRVDMEKPDIVALLRPDVQRWLQMENQH